MQGNGYENVLAFPRIVAWVLILHVLLIGVYDFVAAIYWGRAFTVSNALLHLVSTMPITGILFGIVIGHLFFPQGKLNVPVQVIEDPPPPVTEVSNDAANKPAE